MPPFNLDEYEPVAARLAKFYAEHPDGRVLTELKASEGGTFIVAATLYKDASDLVWTTGLATETMGGQGANQLSALENCETSAIGRALANAGYAGSDPSKRASREEMAKVNRGPAKPYTKSGAQAPPATSAPRPGGASEKQRAFFFKLLDEKDVSAYPILPDIDALSKGEASKWLDQLVACPDVDKAARGKTVAEAVAKTIPNEPEPAQDDLSAFSEEPF